MSVCTEVARPHCSTHRYVFVDIKRPNRIKKYLLTNKKNERIDSNILPSIREARINRRCNKRDRGTIMAKITKQSWITNSLGQSVSSSYGITNSWGAPTVGERLAA